MIVAVVATDEAGAIGRAGAIPWQVPSDLRRFRELTMGGVVLVGRRTWSGMPPLRGRATLVLTWDPGALATTWRVVAPPGHPPTMFTGGGDAPEAVLRRAQRLADEQALVRAVSNPHVYVAGGAQVYRQYLAHCDRLVLTRVALLVPDADTWLEHAPGQRFDPLAPPPGWRCESTTVHPAQAGDEAWFTTYDFRRAD